jgi:hypothetical protein
MSSALLCPPPAIVALMGTAINLDMGKIPYISITKHKKPTYLQVVSTLRPNKANPRCIQLTVGSNHIVYAAHDSTKTADLTTTKILINSILSTTDARFLRISIKDLHLGAPMADKKYMYIPLQMLPQAIVDQYNLTPLIHNNCVYM